MNSRISPAIIMRIKKYGESDLLIGFLTPDQGQLKGIAKGARKSKKRFPNCLDLFCLTNIEYDEKSRGDLHFLHSCKLIHPYPELRSDYDAIVLASHLIELTEVLFPLGVVEKQAFNLLHKALLALNEGLDKDTLRIRFEAMAMRLGGYAIIFDRCCFCGRRYAGEGKAVFDVEKGSIACLNCRNESETRPCLNPDSVKALMKMQNDMRMIEDVRNLTNEIKTEVKPVLKRHIEFRIGKRLKASTYL